MEKGDRNWLHFTPAPFWYLDPQLGPLFPAFDPKKKGYLEAEQKMGSFEGPGILY